MHIELLRETLSRRSLEKKLNALDNYFNGLLQFLFTFICFYCIFFLN